MGGIMRKKSAIQHVHPTVTVPAPHLVAENHALKAKLGELDEALQVEKAKRGKVTTSETVREVIIENPETERRLNAALRENGELKQEMRKRPGELREIKIPVEAPAPIVPESIKTVYVSVPTISKLPAAAIAFVSAVIGWALAHFL